MDCLITKLKGTVNDDTLMKLGELRIKSSFSSITSLEFTFKERVTLSLPESNNTYFTDSSGDANYGKALKYNANENKKCYIKGGNTTLSIDDKYSIILLSLDVKDDSKKSIINGLNELKYSNSLEKIYLTKSDTEGDLSEICKPTLSVLNIGNTKITGDSKLLSACKGLQEIQAQDVNVIFNLEDLRELTEMNFLSIKKTPSIGGTSSLSGLTKLTSLEISGTDISGDISSLSGLTKLTSLDISTTDISGDISNLSGLTKLTSLDISTTDISGDISSLSGLTKLTLLGISGSKAHGNIEVLKQMPNLNNFYGENLTDLSGDYFAILASKSFHSIKCTGTFVYTKQEFEGKNYFEVGGSYFVCQNMDAFLNDFQSATADGNASINMLGTRTSASDAAISVLQGKGFTVTVPAASDASPVSLMNTKVGENFGIAYKDKELIVESVDLSKMQIYPASDVTVKKFDTPEDAEKFIKGYGLVKA